MASRITSCEIHDVNLGASLRFYWNGCVLNIYMYFFLSHTSENLLQL